MINSNLSLIKWYLDRQILASEASRLQIGAANCNQRGGGGGGGAAQSDVSPLHPVQLVCCPLLHAILSPDPITRQHIMSDEDNLLLCVSQVQDMLEL